MFAAVLITIAFAVGVGLLITAARHNPHEPFEDSVQPRRAPANRSTNHQP
jgi:hypothetical protein